MAKRTRLETAKISRGRTSRYKQADAGMVSFKPGTAKGTATKDSFNNFGAQLGVGADNLLSQGTYNINPITRNRTLIEYCYRGSWVCRAVVNVLADDMTREGIDIKSEMDPDEVDELAGGMEDMQIMPSFNEWIKWGRLYGGCIAVLLIDGQDFATPLRIDSIGKGQFKGLAVMDRWMISPDWSAPITDMGPNLGRPSFYEAVPGLVGFPQGRIHYSRCIRYEGIAIPYYQRLTENGWGLSVLEPLWDRLLSFDSATLGAAQLAFKAHLRTLRMEGLRNAIAAGGKAMDGIVKNVEFIRKYQSVEGLTVLDMKDEFEVHTYTFAGLPDVIDRMASQVSGAAEIPLMRLMGEAPTGLNNDGSGVMRGYYDKVKSEQSARMRPGVGLVLECAHRSIFGIPTEDSFGFDFRSLWQLDEKEKAEVAQSVTTSVTTAFSAGVIDQPTALKELRESSDITGVFTNITDKVIKDAENNPPSPMAGLPPAMAAAHMKMLGGPGGEEDGGDGIEGEDDPPARGGATGDEAAWNPADHPRGQPENAGEFGPGGGHSKVTVTSPTHKVEVETRTGGANNGGGPPAAKSSSGNAMGAEELSKSIAGDKELESSVKTLSPANRKLGVGYEFVSPNVETLDFNGATKGLSGPRQKAMLKVSSLIDRALGMEATDKSMIGAWSDGAENSVLTVVNNSDWDRLKLTGAMKGFLADQKAVLVFQQGDGDSVLYKFHAKGDLKSIHDNLLADGVAFHTIVPVANDAADIYVVDMDGSAHDAVARGAERYDAEVEYHRGRGEFIGTSKDDGSDREQRDDARRSYEQAIGESSVQGGAEIWSRIRNRFRKTLGDPPSPRGGGDA